MRKQIVAVGLGMMVAISIVLAGCSAPLPDPANVTETSTPAPSVSPSASESANADWVEQNLTMEGGAQLPAGLDTIVVNNFTGSDAWDLMEQQPSPIQSYRHVSNGCIASHGVLELGTAPVGNDLQASADFLASLQGQDVESNEAVIFPMPFVTDLAATISDEPGVLKIEMAGYPAAGDNSVTIWGARAIEAVGKGFIFAVTCPTKDELDSIWDETRSLVSFGIYDPEGGLGGGL